MAARFPSSSKHTLDDPPPNPNETSASLVEQLNTLLAALNIPFTLLSPTDLTPGILIAILESLLGRRIPLVERPTTCTPKASTSSNSKYTKDPNPNPNSGLSDSDESKRQSAKAAKVTNMKIFLGVLEVDILHADVGLSDVDPRRLADGEWDETVFVGELLCWMGRRLGYIRERTRPRPRRGGFEDGYQAKSAVPRLRGGSAEAEADPRNSNPPHRPPAQSPAPKSQLDIDAESIFQDSRSPSTMTGTGTATGTATGSSTASTQRRLFSPFLQAQALTDGSITSVNVTSVNDDGDEDGYFQNRIQARLHPHDRAEYIYDHDYTYDEDEGEDDDGDQSILSALPPFTPPGRTSQPLPDTSVVSAPAPAPPSCIHEVPSPNTSALFSRDAFDYGYDSAAPNFPSTSTSTSTSARNNDGDVPRLRSHHTPKGPEHPKQPKHPKDPKNSKNSKRPSELNMKLNAHAQTSFCAECSPTLANTLPIEHDHPVQSRSRSRSQSHSQSQSQSHSYFSYNHDHDYDHDHDREHESRYTHDEGYPNSADLSHHTTFSTTTTSTTSSSSVRYTGFIEPADEEAELASFESGRSVLAGLFHPDADSGLGLGNQACPSTGTSTQSASHLGTQTLDRSHSQNQSHNHNHNHIGHRPRSHSRTLKIDEVKEQFARTQELLHQRALLLSQLAELQGQNGKSQGLSGNGRSQGQSQSQSQSRNGKKEKRQEKGYEKSGGGGG